MRSLPIRGVVAWVAGGMLLLTACQAGNVAKSTVPESQRPAATVAPFASSSAPSPTPAGMSAALANSRIIFNRSDAASFLRRPFMTDPDGSDEHALPAGGLQPGVWSPDGRQLVVGHLANSDDAWVRPAMVNADGSDFRVLDKYPDRKLNLVPIGWSPDESRIYVFSGYDAADLADVGLFTVRSSDGGDLTSVLPSAPKDTISGRAGDSCARPDFVHPSPDGLKLLVNRESVGDCGTLFVVNVDGTDKRQLNPKGTTTVELEPWDYIERGGISEGWSPDGSRIAFGAFVTEADSTALYVVGADGSGLRQIVSTDVGAVTAQWSPDGKWIAFTSRFRSQPQVWVVHPDGGGLAKLTDGSDGSTSIAPVWSPDSSKLLFQRKQAGQVTLWTMNVDGGEQRQVSPTPLAIDYTGPYAWWPAK
jgi:Tol biopolymer transport system component